MTESPTLRRRFAVVLPAYNEAAGIETLLWRIRRGLRGHDYEIIVVDDGSTDDTAGIAERLSEEMPLRLVRHEVNQGYGAAIRTGILEGRDRAEVIVTMDADDSHDPSLIPLMLHGIACGSDIIVASRFVPGGREVGVPLHRKVLSHGARIVFKALLRVGDVGDYTSGYRAYRTGFIDDMVAAYGIEHLAEETGFTVGVELLCKAAHIEGRLAEVPLILRYDRKRSESKLKIGTTLREYVELIRRVRESGPERHVVSREDRRRRRPLAEDAAAIVLFDTIGVFLAFALSFLFYRSMIRLELIGSELPDPWWYLGLACLFALSTVFTFWQFGLYMPRLSNLHLRHLQHVAQALTVSVAVFFASLFLLAMNHPSRLLVLGAIVLAYPIVLLLRGAAMGWLRTRRLSKARVSRVLIYGAGKTGMLLAKKIMEAPLLGSEVVGFLDDNHPKGYSARFRLSQMDREELEVRVLGNGSDLTPIAVETGASELYVAVPDVGDERLSTLRAEAEALGLELVIVPRIGAMRPDQVRVTDLGGIPVLRLHHDIPRRGYSVAKRSLDLAIVALLLPIAVPIGLLTAGLVALDGRPILFRQIRIGRHGRPFTVFKFRTMRTDTNPYAVSPLDDTDPRVTQIGRLVRTAGLDELPQMLNVIRGEMSLVGPRPEMPQIVAQYDEVQRQRLAVLPGITGIWQLSPNRSQAIHDNLEYDLYYLRQRRLSFDLLIMGETVVFIGRAMIRTLGHLVREARWPRTVAVDGTTPEIEDGGREYVFVVLDQRRRPDEPASWTRYIPRAATLANDMSVKLAVADRNAVRMRELSNGNSRPPGERRLEYVAYGEREDVHDLTEEASLVVTDLDYVAEWASKHGVAVLKLADDEVPGVVNSSAEDGLARQVHSAFAGTHQKTILSTPGIGRKTE